MLYLNERCKNILNILLVKNDYITMQKLTLATKVSKRSIYYDICKINDWLDSYDIRELVIERGKGVLISAADKIKIEELLEHERLDDGYVFLPSERVKIIICCIIYSSSPVYIEQLTQICRVSRNTVFGDLRVVVSQLREYDLELEYETKSGYQISGDVIRRRALFLLYFGIINPLFQKGILLFFDEMEIQGYFDKLKFVEKELNVNYVDGALLSLSALLPVMYQNEGGLHFAGLKREEVIQSKEYTLVEQHFSDLEENEKIYLCLHLWGSRITCSSTEIFESSSNISVYEITKALVMEFEKLACVSFEEREELERALFVHINSSMYRYQYGIQIGNPMLGDITREYPSLFDITKIVCGYLEKIVGIPIPDSEIAYLALHFGAHLKISKPSADNLRILIVCANGISTGNMLKREIHKLLPDADIVDVVAAVNVKNAHDVCDLMISTVKLKSVIPHIVVRPILTDEDRKNIRNHHMVLHIHKNSLSELIFDAVRKYVNEKDYRNLKSDIVKCIQEEEQEKTGSLTGEQKGLTEYLDISKIQISDRQFIWQESIRFAGECLVKRGSIEYRYIDMIISQTLYYGTYMFLTDEIMLAHAKTEDGAVHTDISMAIFKNPVAFQNSRRANVIFVLSADDHEKHLKLLNDIFTLVEKEEQTERLMELDSPAEVLSYLDEILREN